MSTLRVLSLNIWNRLGPWDERRPLLRDGIARLQPDLIGLQEVLRHDTLDADQTKDLVGDLGYHVAYARAWHIGGGLWLGNAALSRWPIVDEATFELPNQDGEETRSLLATTIDAPFGRVPFFVTHLAWKLHQAALRLEQVAFIADRIAERAPVAANDYPPILVGDFNAEPDSDEIRYLKGHKVRDGRSVYFADAWGYTDGALVDGRVDPGWTFARRNPHARVTREPNRRLDYVFVRGPDRRGRGEPLSCRVVLDDPSATGVFPSDHFGVLAELARE